MSDLLILLNGPAAARRRAGAHREVFVADGGLRHFDEVLWESLEKLVWCGDGDSVDSSHLRRIEGECARRKIEFQALKKSRDDLSDFAMILDFIRSKGLGRVSLEILGGLGGASDHEAVNLLEAIYFTKMRTSDSVVSFEDRTVIARGEFVVEPRGTFSLFSPLLESPLKVSIQGAHYSGDVTLTRPSHGLSNKAIARYVRINTKGAIIQYEAREEMKGDDLY